MCRSERGHLVYVREAGQRGENRIRARSGPVRAGAGRQNGRGSDRSAGPAAGAGPGRNRAAREPPGKGT
ncbi:hypothetical protein L810_6602 [Burkholderia sp. AU4i]|nr:hypothetical protein L810_6602 [Burkholderia sp. AU4i]